MKTLEIINSLTPIEQKEFKKVIKAHKRTALYPLYRYFVQQLGKEDANLEKEILFQKAFAKKYHTDKDYLLRNELRHLNQALREFLNIKLWEEWAKKNHLESSLLYVERLLEKKQYRRFEVEINQIEEAALKQQNFEILQIVKKLWFSYLQKTSEISLQTYKDMSAITVENLLYLKLNYEEEKSNQIINYTRSQRILEALAPQYKAQQLEEKKVSTPILQFLKQVSLSYKLRGKDKIELLQKAIYNHQQIADIRPQYTTLALKLYFSLGLEYFLMRAHDQADEIYKKGLSMLDSESITNVSKLEILYNYCSNLICIDAFDEAQAIIDEHRSEIALINSLKYRYKRLETVLYIYKKQSDKAIDILLDEKIGQRPNSEYYYGRILLVAAYFQANMWEQSDRELRNILQAFRYRTPEEHSQIQIVHFFKQFLQLHAKPKDQQQTGYEILIKKINDEQRKTPELWGHHLRWLKRAIVEQQSK